VGSTNQISGLLTSLVFYTSHAPMHLVYTPIYHPYCISIMLIDPPTRRPAFATGPLLMVSRNSKGSGKQLLSDALFGTTTYSGHLTNRHTITSTDARSEKPTSVASETAAICPVSTKNGTARAIPGRTDHRSTQGHITSLARSLYKFGTGPMTHFMPVQLTY
jgi:hypothetical protein